MGAMALVPLLVIGWATFKGRRDQLLSSHA
jgi:hypothetical protein